MQEGAQGRVKRKHREQEPRSREGTAENRTEEGKKQTLSGVRSCLCCTETESGCWGHGGETAWVTISLGDTQIW